MLRKTKSHVSACMHMPTISAFLSQPFSPSPDEYDQLNFDKAAGSSYH